MRREYIEIAVIALIAVMAAKAIFPRVPVLSGLVQFL
jgi:hypothetical protein